MTGRNKIRLVLYPTLLAIPIATVGWGTCMPGKSHRGPLPPFSDDERKLSAELREDVQAISGRRNLTQDKARLDEAKAYLGKKLAETGLEVREDAAHNLDVEIKGSNEIVVVGGHYDSAINAAGADDNATGAAGAVALARRFAKKPGKRTLRLAIFSNEEMPYFGTDEQGSLAYAKACKARNENVVAMLSLETMGYFKDAPDTQHYPWGFGALYPSEGNFIGFVGDLGSRGLVRDAVRTFRETTAFPSEGAALPRMVPGVGWSDHWSFWQAGYPAVMVTDTAPFRNPHYHTMGDLPETIDFDRFARVMTGIERVVDRLVNPG